MFVVGIGGSTDPQSLSERILRDCLEEIRGHGAETQIFTAADLEMPLYSTQIAERTPEIRAFLEAVGRADGFVLVSPAYHASISGRIKNALDYIEDLKSNPVPYIDGKAVGCISVGGGHMAATQTLDALRTVVHAVRGWPVPMGLAISSHEPVNEKVRAKISTIARQVISR
jgi:FMN reductase